MSFNRVFITVGTTQFDKLINTVIQEDTMKVLKQKQCRHLVIQIGTGEVEPNINDDEIALSYYRFKNSIQDDVKAADLVISHAGAGTCLDVLENKKPLVTVINDDLMHNHQTELAKKLSEDGYCFSCTCSSLADTIRSINPFTLTPFNNDNNKKCAMLIEKFLFSDEINKPE